MSRAVALLLLALAGVAGVAQASTPAQVPNGPAVPLEVQATASQIRAQAEVSGQDVAQAFALSQPQIQALAVARTGNRRMLSTPAQVPSGPEVPVEVQTAAAQVRAKAQASGQDVSQALAQAQPEIQAAAQAQPEIQAAAQAQPEIQAAAQNPPLVESGAPPTDAVQASDSGPDSWQNGGWHAGGWGSGGFGGWDSGRNWDRWGRWGNGAQLQNTQGAPTDATVAAAATKP